MTPARPIIIVMVKAPRPGAVKTRLTPPLPDDAAAGLAAAFVRDAVAKARTADIPVMIAYAPDDGRPLLEALLPDGLHWTRQKGRSLGDRMGLAMADAQRLGYGPLIVIGTDSPTLPTACLGQAITALVSGEGDVVLGPTEDGGYYLVGVSRLHAGLFAGVAWSTSRAFAHTAANAARLGLRVVSLPAWYDIDTPNDLDRLRREIGADAALQRRLPATAAWLQSHSEISRILRPVAF